MVNLWEIESKFCLSDVKKCTAIRVQRFLLLSIRVKNLSFQQTDTVIWADQFHSEIMVYSEGTTPNYKILMKIKFIFYSLHASTFFC